MSWALALQAASGVAGIIGGNRQAGAAREARRAAELRADAAIAAGQRDQARLIEYRKADEARLVAATGFDFQKMRDQAIAAGFNPLTVLAATGGAGYDGRSAVLETPFVSEAEDQWRKVDVYTAMSGAVTQTAGGGWQAASDALSALGDQLNVERDQALGEADLGLRRQQMVLDYAGFGRGGSGGQYAAVANGNAFSNAPAVATPGGFWADLWGQYGATAGDFSSGWTKATQGVTAMVGNALGMQDPNASWATGRQMSPEERGGAEIWSGFWDRSTRAITRLPYDIRQIPGTIGKGWAAVVDDWTLADRYAMPSGQPQKTPDGQPLGWGYNRGGY